MPKNGILTDSPISGKKKGPPGVLSAAALFGRIPCEKTSERLASLAGFDRAGKTRSFRPAILKVGNFEIFRIRESAKV
jgi:hypothetical protein